MRIFTSATRWITRESKLGGKSKRWSNLEMMVLWISGVTRADGAKKHGTFREATCSLLSKFTCWAFPSFQHLAPPQQSSSKSSCGVHYCITAIISWSSAMIRLPAFAGCWKQLLSPRITIHVCPVTKGLLFLSRAIAQRKGRCIMAAAMSGDSQPCDLGWGLCHVVETSCSAAVCCCWFMEKDCRKCRRTALHSSSSIPCHTC